MQGSEDHEGCGISRGPDFGFTLAGCRNRGPPEKLRKMLLFLTYSKGDLAERNVRTRFAELFGPHEVFLFPTVEASSSN